MTTWVAATASIPSDMMKFLSFDPRVRSMDNLAKRVAFWINVDNWQIIAWFIFQVRLNRDNVENFLSRTVLHGPQGGWVAWAVKSLTCKTEMPQGIKHRTAIILPSVIVAEKASKLLKSNLTFASADYSILCANNRLGQSVWLDVDTPNKQVRIMKIKFFLFAVFVFCRFSYLFSSAIVEIMLLESSWW